MRPLQPFFTGKPNQEYAGRRPGVSGVFPNLTAGPAAGGGFLGRGENSACIFRRVVLVCLSKTRPGVAKFGIAPEWGSGGRWFKSSHSDHPQSLGNTMFPRLLLYPPQSPERPAFGIYLEQRFLSGPRQGPLMPLLGERLEFRLEWREAGIAPASVCSSSRLIHFMLVFHREYAVAAASALLGTARSKNPLPS